MKRGTYRELDYDFGQAMLTLRNAIGLTQGGLAEVLGVSRQSVAEWEAGNKYPKAKHLQAFIVLAMQHQAFSVGYEADEIHKLWKSARQKVLLSEAWLASLIAPDTPAAKAQSTIQSVPPAPLDVKPQPLHQRSFGFPFQPTSFVGRGTEIADITRILRNPACRLLTLMGPGGVGKTRLALEVAAGHTAAYADGVAFVSLASISTADEIVFALRDTFHLHFGNDSDPVDYLIGYLRERHLMLVLDNFEHLLDGIKLIYDILEQAPRVVILVTSRERLNMRAEWLFDLQGMSYPPVDSSGRVASLSPASMSVYSAVQLFIQRAIQVRRDFSLNESTLHAIVHICQRVAGLPLAIELAAASVRFMPVEDIDRLISSNLDSLATTLSDVPARHRSLRAVFDHSWNLMTPWEQAAFVRLAVFRGVFTTEASETVAGLSLAGLMTFVDKSLVRQANATDRAGNMPRFLMLEPIREYALQRLNAAELEALRYTHAEYFLALAEAARSQWDKPTAETALEELDRELDNMHAALHWTASGGNAMLGLRLAEALVRYWRSRGYLDEARQWLEALLALTAHESELAALDLRMRSTYVLALICTDQHDYSCAALRLEQFRALRHALGASADELTLLINQAQQARSTGEYPRAASLLEEALAQCRINGDLGTLTSGGYGFVLYSLANVMREQGNYDGAKALYMECHAFHLSVGDREGATQGLLGLSDVARDVGHTAELRHYASECLSTYREFGTQWAIGFCLNNLAMAAYQENELSEAFALVSESLDVFREQKSSGAIAEVLITQAAVLLAQGRYSEAHAALMESLQRAWVTGPRLIIIAALEGLGCTLMCCRNGKEEKAIQLFSVTEMLRRRMGVQLRPADRPIRDLALKTARLAIGEAEFGKIWAQAQRLTLEQVASAVAFSNRQGFAPAN